MMDFQQTTLTMCATAAAYVLYKRYRTSMISDIHGPKNPSWRYGIEFFVPVGRRSHLTDFGTGHTWWWQREEFGVVDKMILDEYGTVARWNGSLGVHSFSAARRRGTLTLILLCRKNACGSPTPRQSTIFSTVLVLCTRNPPTSGK